MIGGRLGLIMIYDASKGRSSSSTSFYQLDKRLSRWWVIDRVRCAHKAIKPGTLSLLCAHSRSFRHPRVATASGVICQWKFSLRVVRLISFDYGCHWTLRVRSSCSRRESTKKMSKGRPTCVNGSCSELAPHSQTLCSTTRMAKRWWATHWGASQASPSLGDRCWWTRWSSSSKHSAASPRQPRGKRRPASGPLARARRSGSGQRAGSELVCSWENSSWNEGIVKLRLGFGRKSQMSRFWTPENSQQPNWCRTCTRSAAGARSPSSCGWSSRGTPTHWSGSTPHRPPLGCSYHNVGTVAAAGSAGRPAPFDYGWHF